MPEDLTPATETGEAAGGSHKSAASSPGPVADLGSTPKPDVIEDGDAATSGGGIAPPGEDEEDPSGAENARPIEGGFVSFSNISNKSQNFTVQDANESSNPAISFKDTEAKHRADTARFLAYSLVAILGLSFLLHYVVMLVAALNGFDKVADTVSSQFSAWLPAITGLVSAAVTYYFTRETASGGSK